ncbi:MAG TPA: stress response translation initiation inhibitor YciH, partial [Alteromonas sp.]|nr:stress response translation initiation inhibitor YciH [Alteromonas sp.]
MQNSRLVYSTDGGKVDQSRQDADIRSVNKDGIARIQRETKGRKG